ncbi:hypothetical protein HUA74_30400 [Myxococcus sp. CA051A]|uniref:hypothetical protein n=1 Tax=unclassified Myxococcus TaxID=2648731 RepID=UPI00157ABB39|nr:MULTISPECIES: hypothetical protein [unclassified Myxococcus]NTX51467.1 hypothetical protein [Myxococcus sp. CA039A]NTX64974.1 hypothetical protein [Myxococcus sp. CA051A]
MRILAIALVTLCAAACGGAKSHVRPQDLAGTWDSATCEAVPNGDGSNNYLQRHFQLTESDWTLRLDFFRDAGCQTKLFTARVVGPYSLGQDSEKVSGATEGTFTFGERYLTAHLQPLADVFTQSGCGTGAWTVGVEQPVPGACLSFKPLTECGRDHDVVKVEGTQLFFGQRPADNDLCAPEKRPQALATHPVVKH